MRHVSLALCLVLAFAVSVEAASGARDVSAPAPAAAKKKCKRGYTRNKRGRCVKKKRGAGSTGVTETSRPFSTTTTADATAVFTQLLTGAKLYRVVATARQLPQLPGVPQLPDTGLPLPTTGSPLPTTGLPQLPTTDLPQLPLPTTGSTNPATGLPQLPTTPTVPSTPGAPLPTLGNEGYFFCAGGKLSYLAEYVTAGQASLSTWQGTWSVVNAVALGDLVAGTVKFTPRTAGAPGGQVEIDLYRSTQQAFIGPAPGQGVEFQRLPGLGVGC